MGSSELPQLAEHHLTVIDEAEIGGGGFLSLRRRRLSSSLKPDSSFAYDEVDRRALDAVVILAFERTENGSHVVYLRSCLRPPVYFRDPTQICPGTEYPKALWELPAGLVEKDENSEEGLSCAAQRELREELGFQVELKELLTLGPGVFPAPGFCGERQFFFFVDVTGKTQESPSLDGSILEETGVVAKISLDKALELLDLGEIPDAKTEIGLRRFASRFTASSI